MIERDPSTAGARRNRQLYAQYATPQAGGAIAVDVGAMPIAGRFVEVGSATGGGGGSGAGGPGKVNFSGAIDGGGYKKRMDDPTKLQPSMIPPVFIEGVSQVLMFGAQKYSRGNWMRGMSFTDVLDAIMTHTLAIQRGEDLDHDSGMPHIYHIGCGLAFLSWYQYGPRASEYAAFDDRLFKGDKTHG